MNVFGQLKKACLEILSSSPSGSVSGRIWWRSDTGKAEIDSGTQKRAVLLNDDKAVIGNSGTASNNVRFHRGADGVLQHVTGNDGTSEGTLSTSLAQVSGKVEGYTDSGKPTFGNAGRLAYLTDLFGLALDIGTSWKYLVDTTTAQTLTNKTIAGGSNTISGITVGMMSSGVTPDGYIPKADGFGNVTWINPATQTTVIFAPQSSDPVSPTTGQMFYADGTSRTAGVWVYNGSGWVQLSGDMYQEFSVKDYFQVRVATTANGTLSTAFANGQTLDGITLATNDLILLKNQSTATENGVYTVNASGAPTRASAADTFSELNKFSVIVNDGTTNKNTTWFQTATLTSLSDNQVWASTPGSQTFTVPAGVKKLRFVGAGGGGGGGAGGGVPATGGSDHGGGGGAGGSGAPVGDVIVNVTPGETVTITPGKGGARVTGNSTSGATANSGGNGTSTTVVGSFGTITFVGALGGVGGVAGTSGGASGTGGAGAAGVLASPIVAGTPSNSRGGTATSGSSGTPATGGSGDAELHGASGGTGGVSGAGGTNGGNGGGGGASLGAGGQGGAGGTATYAITNPVSVRAGVDAPNSGGGGGGGGGGTGSSAGGANKNGCTSGAGGCGIVRVLWT